MTSENLWTDCTAGSPSFFPINPQPKCQDRADWQREEKASVSICWTGVWQWWLHSAMRTNLLWSTASIPPGCVIHLPGDPPEETAPSQSSSKRLGMSCTATDGIYVIHRALPRPCLSFLGEAWPATVTNPQRDGRRNWRRRRRRRREERCDLCILMMCFCNLWAEYSRPDLRPPLLLLLKMHTSRRERLWKLGGKKHNEASSSIREKEKINKSATKVRWRTCRRRGLFLLSCGLNIQKSYSHSHNKW